MGFLSASAGFTRFRITDPVPDELWPQAHERLKKYAFQEIEDTTDERRWGWVSIENMLDNRWREAPPEKGEYLAFTLRLDTRRIPPAVFKKHLAIATAEEERKVREQGRKYVSRERKKELKEQVKLRLMARTLPIPAVFDVIWAMRENVVYLCSTRSNISEIFTQLFTDTFELHVEPLTPYSLGVKLLGEGEQKRLDEVEATIYAR
ncbi:MAG: recombination-associated protein RdgC [Desulfovibrionaceae bacterium]|jgi:DNA recombination-dependent growth factor C|nr:recombination-associated protein RdgC [Desulfovibrionaceae bacterium]